jgi:hypothetical protein
MRRMILAGLAGLALASCLTGSRAADCSCGHRSCTDTGFCQECVPACKGTWDEKKSSKPKYTMKCEHACARGRDSWHTPPPECRCSPPCGNVYVKKRLYKADGPEKVEKVPEYDVKMVPADPCDCAACRGGHHRCWWDPRCLFSGFSHGR